jgi:SAM-dependent methyltransferase
MKDLFGQAIYDYHFNQNPEDLITETSISEADEMPVEYLFRTYKQMPKIEQKALQLTKGKVLDAGCGAGSHAIYLQEEKKLAVTAIDISPKAIEVCKDRGINDARVLNVLDLKDETFDTIILLMNGIGIAQQLKKISTFLTHLKSLLNPGGQILLDSSDIIYMFDEDEDGGKWIPSERDYYGEVSFTVAYKGETEIPFDWLYIDYNTLQNAAHANGLNCELVIEGENFDYLARLTHL